MHRDCHTNNIFIYKIYKDIGKIMKYSFMDLPPQ